jgi:hypothetical protein
VGYLVSNYLSKQGKPETQIVPISYSKIMGGGKVKLLSIYIHAIIKPLLYTRQDARSYKRNKEGYYI